MSKDFKKFKPIIYPIKISKREYLDLISFFKHLQLDFISLMGSVQKSEKYIEEPSKSFPFCFNQLSLNKLDLLGPTVEVDGKIFKFIKEESVSLFKKLWESGLLQILNKKKWIPTISISPYFYGDYPLIIEIEHLPNLMGLRETPSMQKRKEICVFISFLCYVISGTGYVLTDPHSGNFGLSKGHCYYYDIGSFNRNNGHVNQYSLVIGGLESILFSYFPKSLLSTWDMFTSRNDYKYRIPREYSDEYLRYSKKFILYHFFHSSKIVYKAAKKCFKYFQVLPWDLLLLFFDKQSRTKSEIERICQI